MKTRIVVLAYLALAAAFASALASGQTVFTQCALENGTCTLTGPKLMRYGHPFGAGAWTAARTLGPGAIPCTNAYWTDPAPGTGKRCEVMDAPAAPVPLPLGSSRYEIKWTPATTNTDGTPIGPILGTTIQVSDTADFARTLQWVNTGPVTSYLVSQAPNLSPLYWRAKHTTAAGDSVWTTPAVKTEAQLIAQGKPACWPSVVKGGTGRVLRWRVNPIADAFAVYWQCQDAAGVWSHSGYVGKLSELDDDADKQLETAQASANPGAAYDSIWNARAKPAVFPDPYAAGRAMHTAIRVATPLLAGEVWTVKALTGSSSRPATALVNGARTTTVVGRVGIGMACDCAAHKSGTAANTYCAVTGIANVATAAVDVLPASAAICARVP